jgi:hypothetical protein
MQKPVIELFGASGITCCSKQKENCGGKQRQEYSQHADADKYSARYDQDPPQYFAPMQFQLFGCAVLSAGRV